MSTHRSTWKRRERDAARLFGARRQVLSGSSGREDVTGSDTTHERLFIETKLRVPLESIIDRPRKQPVSSLVGCQPRRDIGTPISTPPCAPATTATSTLISCFRRSHRP